MRVSWKNEKIPKQNGCLLCFIVQVRSLLSFLSRFPDVVLSLAEHWNALKMAWKNFYALNKLNETCTLYVSTIVLCMYKKIHIQKCISILKKFFFLSHSVFMSIIFSCDKIDVISVGYFFLGSGHSSIYCWECL